MLWRLLGQLLLLLVLTLLFAILLGGLLFLNLSPEANLLVQQAIAACAVTVSVFLARRRLDRRSIRSLGLVWDHLAVQDLLVGVALPGLMMGLVFLVEWGLGWINLEGVAWQTKSPGQIILSLLLLLGMFVLVGWSEELFSRGYFLQNLADGLNLFWGVLLSSVGFAALHYANPSFNLSALPFLGLVLAGLFLAFGWLRTRQLWLPIGLHIGWNFFEGPVFGFPVSGLDIPRLLLHRETGPDLFTGGPFGPEAGLILLPALAMGTLLVYVYTRGRAGDKGLATGD
jgi:membrane protease YdiL (CAAX protease family)